MNRKQRRATAKLGQPAAAPTASDTANGLRIGLDHHRAGRLAEAEACYRRALALSPNNADVLHLLGVIAHQKGRHGAAVELIRRAIERNEHDPSYFSNLGAALNAQGRLNDAAAAYANAIRIKPDLADAHFNLGITLKQQGRLEEAIAAYARAIRIRADYAEAHCNLGVALKDTGKLDAAAASLREAIRSKPSYAEAHSNLGIILNEQGKLDEALAAHTQAIRIKPDLAAAYSNLGAVLKEQGKLDAAVVAHTRAIRVKPHYAEGHSNLGIALKEQGNLEAAVAAFREAIRIKPEYAEAYSNVGVVLKEQGRHGEAVAAHTQALRLKPDYAEGYSNLGMALKEHGRLEDAASAYLQAIRINPNLADAFSNLLFCLNYEDGSTADRIFATHREWEQRYGSDGPRPTAYANARDPQRRLRIGYVSPDFRRHSVAYFLEPLLDAHDRNSVEVFCYADVIRPDAVTHRLKAFADHWIMTVGMSDDTLAARIAGDGVDILVDLAGHTGRNRLRVFARKPAPVQVTWLGYPNTTGLNAIDYRLVDAVTDPDGSDAFASERLIRLEGGFLCYAPAPDAPEPAPPPSVAAGAVTFASFNNPAKLSSATLDVWAALLARRPQARLLLKSLSFADADTRALFLERLRQRGVAEERVELTAWLPGVASHLATYHRVDIALDPFPYNGTTTTCEALWMGVPVVTLRGERHAGRVGASLLTQVGLENLIAGSAEEYVEIALGLADDAARRAKLRRSLRSAMAASPLCDAGAFARKMEAAFRAMWQHWCEAPTDDQGVVRSCP